MSRISRLAFGLFAALLAAQGGVAHAQYGSGYYGGGGGYGWGGWGGGSTVAGSILTGEAREVAAEGQYNQNTAVANSINTDTAMRWNQYWYDSQVETSRERHARLVKDRQRMIVDYDKYHNQLRYNPSEADIARGDALNAILDQVTDPKIHSSAIRSGAGMTVPAALVKDIPFTSPTQAVTFSLYNMTNDDEWPLSLKNDNLADERKAFRDAVTNALALDKDGKLNSDAVAAVRDAARKLRADYEKNPPQDKAAYIEGENFVKTLTGISRMLEKPAIDKALGELEKIKDTSVGNLMGFMHAYNLRFASATTERQRAAYLSLYPMMAALRDQLVPKPDPNAQPAPAQARNAGPRRPPANFYQGMNYDQLQGNPPPNPTPGPGPERTQPQRGAAAAALKPPVNRPRFCPAQHPGLVPGRPRSGARPAPLPSRAGPAGCVDTAAPGPL